MFHRFPRNEGQKARWINSLRNINGSTWEPKDPLFVCSEHFDRFSWERVREDGKRKLKIGAIPSVFNDSLPSKLFNEHTYSMPLPVSANLKGQISGKVKILFCKKANPKPLVATIVILPAAEENFEI
ncbi:THAP domain-containing protein 6-like [Temnothorax curvispinosus]|uniref:THAP domain-containing protein 6-like n=1 Tax=Temnothorax curvispinosus TaxID=300111 RepID=A0A6J1QL03_9HYME|nr:THAP domain-containing protein 6-like [Temnothorax curvispinosus]